MSNPVLQADHRPAEFTQISDLEYHTALHNQRRIGRRLLRMRSTPGGTDARQTRSLAKPPSRPPSPGARPPATPPASGLKSSKRSTNAFAISPTWNCQGQQRPPRAMRAKQCPSMTTPQYFLPITTLPVCSHNSIPSLLCPYQLLFPRPAVVPSANVKATALSFLGRTNGWSASLGSIQGTPNSVSLSLSLSPFSGL
mmetsp:Transcript_1331/g.3564  ORF Transcript_1331/g.3564 Transcript_1331/m.3564 type:complete len:197 (+) Transcript_1331:364-954(+)